MASTPTAHSLTQRATAWRHLSSRAGRRTLSFYLFIVPWLLGFVFLGIAPLFAGALTSLTNYDGLNLATIKFVGPDNYIRVLSDKDVVYSFSRTFLWTILNTPIWILLSFGLALLLNQEIKGQALFRTLFYLPSVIPLVATVWVWRVFLNDNYGLLNGLLGLIRPGTAIQWLTAYALPSLTAIAVWGGLGNGMVVFLAGLQGIPDELKEAARIDGASPRQVFWHVTFPLMTPVLFFQLVLAIISAFQALAVPLLLSTTPSNAGLGAIVPRPVYFFLIHSFRQIFVFQRFGYGSALIWILSLVIIALTFVLFRTARYWVYYEVAVEGES